MLSDSSPTIEFYKSLPQNHDRIYGGLRIQDKFHKKSDPNKPLVSIITVSHNCEKTIEQTIQSVLNQTYDNIEYIIIDGGSTDSTLNIIRNTKTRLLIG